MVKVGDRLIGPGRPLFFIAEIGLNHNQDFDMARRLIDVSAKAGCSAAKFQTFRAKDVYVDRALAGSYRLMGKDIPIYDLHAGLEMPEDWVGRLKRHCDERGIVFFSAPVGREAADLLESSGAPAFKVSSYECSNIPFVRWLAAKGRPIVLSTGAATLGEVEETVRVIQDAGAPLALMHCIAKYPAPFRSANLAVMDTLRSAFQLPVGFSDNGFADDKGAIDVTRVPVAAAQAGADLFEVHITLDRALPGPDHGFATEPAELKEMVARMAEARAAYNAGRRTAPDPELAGSSEKRSSPEEAYVRGFAYKCLYAAKDIAAGERLTPDNVCVLRPGQHRRGIEPRHFDLVTGRAVSRRPIPRWEPITWELLLS